MGTPRKPKPVTNWYCLDCEARGLTIGTDSGEDQKHVDETKHATMTSTQMGFGVTSTQED